jgi:hypothetical protein
MFIGNGITGTITASPHHHLDNRHYKPDTDITSGKSQQEIAVGSQSGFAFLRRASEGFIAPLHLLLHFQHLEQSRAGQESERFFGALAANSGPASERC